MKPLTAIAISGGIDSLLAGYLLKQQGHVLFAVHFKTGYNRDDPSSIADQLEIPYHVIDLRKEFERQIIRYFGQSYQAGKTPNPCMLCNPLIKFGLVFEHARKLGASRLATGHYARIETNSQKRVHLYQALDTQKDQSYFLARLTQQQLARSLFPLGSLLKSDVKVQAARLGLTPVTRAESQDICFFNNCSLGEFLCQSCGIAPRPGPIEDLSGKLLGEHNGLHLFTIGQRRGINCPAPEPYYVVRLDIERNRLIVGSKKDLLSATCRVVDINWVAAIPVSPVIVHTRVRYRHSAVPSRLTIQNDRSAVVEFEAPQSAVTPGQGAVFYQGKEVIGGGWIE